MAEPEAGTPEAWLRKLYKEIVDRRPRLDLLQGYYEGDHRLAFASEKFREAFGNVFSAFADNWCEVVVDAVVERENIEGFRVSPDATQPDADAWRLWQENQLDALSTLAHQEAHTAGESYGVAWFGANGTADLTIDSAYNVALATHPKTRRIRHAALRVYMDDWGFEHAELFLPGDVWLFKSKTKNEGISEPSTRQWEADTTVPGADENGRMANPLGVVPVVAFTNKPRLRRRRGTGIWVSSEIHSIIPLQDGVNKLIADMLVASEVAAMPGRAIIGWEPDVDPETGQETPPEFKPWDRVTVLEDPTSQVVQLMAGDLGNFVKAIDLLVQHIASLSRTPPHYLNASADRLSGESIKAAETGLVAKARRCHRDFGEAWEEYMRLGGQIAEIPALANAQQMEVIWRDPESRTESEHIDAVVKRRQGLEVPIEQAWEDAGYTPSQIARMRTARLAERLDADIQNDDLPDAD